MNIKDKLKDKNLTQLKGMLSNNKEQIISLQETNKIIEELIQSKSNEIELKNGLYLVDDSQEILAYVKDGFVSHVYSSEYNTINKPINIKITKGEPYFNFQRKKRKLTFVLSEELKRRINYYVFPVFRYLKTKDDFLKIEQRLNEFLTFQSDNPVINDAKNVAISTMTNVNKLIFNDTNIDLKSLLQLLDLKYVHQLLSDNAVNSDQIYITINGLAIICNLIINSDDLSEFINFIKKYSNFKDLKTFNEKYFNQPQKVNL